MLRDGTCVLEQYWQPWVASDRPLVYSVSKTFTATAVGLAIGEGRFGLADRVVDLLPEAASDDPDVAGITVHHLLSMSTGHTDDTLLVMMERQPEEWARAFLSIRPERPVGSWHVYNNGASFLLGELVRRHTGEDLLDYLRPRVLEPLGIDATWDRDPLGRCLGWSGLHVDLRGLAALGELLRCDGVWQGRRLLPEGWVARATANHIPTISDGADWNHGYGYQVWMGREGFRLDGAYGQFAFVLPERGLVVAVQSAQLDTQCLIDTVWAHLDELPEEPLPDEQTDALRDAAGSFLAVSSSGSVASTGEDLAPSTFPEEPARNEGALSTVPEERAGEERTWPRHEGAAVTTSLEGATALPVPADSGAGSSWSTAGRVPTDPALFSPGDEVGPPADVADPTATRTADGFRLTLVAEGRPVELTAVPGRWARQSLAVPGEATAENAAPSDAEVPVAVAAGVDAAGDLHVHLVFTDTPHTLRLRLGADGTAAQGWSVNPLQGPSLANMRAH
ncbi:MAG: serine hydrolase [Propionicimonas sp.]|uniref:serine hydrolase domain-containing protein n=1 Tax=Propionicimonas sp. TaxID=1955623 RepID=UPI003D10A149